ncbi:hypothetical protein ACNCVO_004692 [Escherichia coli]
MAGEGFNIVRVNGKVEHVSELVTATLSVSSLHKVNNMNADEKVNLTLELDQNVAWALAQFCKRTSHQDCAERSTSEDEAYLMMDGVNAVMREMAESGINPR